MGKLLGRRGVHLITAIYTCCHGLHEAPWSVLTEVLIFISSKQIPARDFPHFTRLILSILSAENQFVNDGS
jgi:hypothetical protein